MGPKRRFSQSQSKANDRGLSFAFFPAATTPVPRWEDYTYEKLADARVHATMLLVKTITGGK